MAQRAAALAMLLTLAVGMAAPVVCPMAACAAPSEHACCPPPQAETTLAAASCCPGPSGAEEPAALAPTLVPDAGIAAHAVVAWVASPTAVAAPSSLGPPPVRPPALAASSQVLLI